MNITIIRTYECVRLIEEKLKLKKFHVNISFSNEFQNIVTSINLFGTTKELNRL